MRNILKGGISKALVSERMTMYMELTLLDRKKVVLLLDIYFYFLHINEEHLNLQQFSSKTQKTYNKHVQTKTENQLCNR